MRLLTSPVFLSVCALVLFAAVGIKGLTKEGFYTSHDGENHTARIAQYFQAIADGQVPPRFANSFYNYLGSPIFVYIYPLPYALGALIHFLGFSYANSFKILMSLGYVLSGIFTFLWLKEVFKSEKAAFFGALLYIWAPYRFLLIYVRASLSELLAYTFVPLVFFALTKLAAQKNIKWASISALCVSSVLLSQNLVALITVPLFIAYIVINAFYEKSLKFLALALFSLFWGFLIASITYLPSFFERTYVRFDQIINIAFVNHFVTLKQLIRSPWGYGFDLPGTVNDQMSFQIGLIHLFVLFLSVVLLLYLPASKNKFIYSLGNKFFSKQDSKLYPMALFFLGIFLISVFLMIQTKYSLYLWQNFKSLQVIDIPWRFLGISTLSLSFIGAFVAKSIKPGLLFILLVILVLLANRNHLRINESRSLDDDFFNNYKDTATQYNEFTPKWRQTDRSPVDYDFSQKAEVLEGTVIISNATSNAKGTEFDADVTSTSATLRVNKFYFPQTDVKVDAKSSPFNITDSQNTDLSKQKDTSGLITVVIPNGKHNVSVRYFETNLRLIADILSLVSAVAALGIIFKNAKV